MGIDGIRSTGGVAIVIGRVSSLWLSSAGKDQVVGAWLGSVGLCSDGIPVVGCRGCVGLGVVLGFAALDQEGPLLRLRFCHMVWII